MRPWLRSLLVLILLAPVALMTALMACEALPTTKGWVAGLISPQTMWITSTVYCLACLALIYQNETSQS